MDALLERHKNVDDDSKEEVHSAESPERQVTANNADPKPSNVCGKLPNANARGKENRRRPFKHLTAIFEAPENVRQFRDRKPAAAGVEDDDVSRISKSQAVIL